MLLAALLLLLAVRLVGKQVRLQVSRALETFLADPANVGRIRLVHFHVLAVAGRTAKDSDTNDTPIRLPARVQRHVQLQLFHESERLVAQLALVHGRVLRTLVHVHRFIRVSCKVTVRERAALFVQFADTWRSLLLLGKELLQLRATEMLPYLVLFELPMIGETFSAHIALAMATPMSL